MVQLLLLLAPLLLVVQGGFWVEGRFTLRYLRGVFENPIYAEGLFNSFRIALGTTTLAVLVALPLAWIAHRYDFAGKRLWTAGVLVPMILPPFVGAIGLLPILGQYGALNALSVGPVTAGRAVIRRVCCSLSLYRSVPKLARWPTSTHMEDAAKLDSGWRTSGA